VNVRAVIALGLLVAMLVVTFIARVVIHYRSTGTSGIVGISGAPGSLAWWGGVIFEASSFLGAPASAVALLDRREDATPPVIAVGTALMVIGIVMTTIAQANMGRSWRVGVDATETTQLVTGGLFRFVRNPIYSAIVITIVGLVILVPSRLSLVTLVALVGSLQVQVRVVEEPYLLSHHGAEYRDYARRVGRFVPGIGRSLSENKTKK
jgi:protein-S-isoprenylcysteine O-methyltransferase Ste14